MIGGIILTGSFFLFSIFISNDEQERSSEAEKTEDMTGEKMEFVPPKVPTTPEEIEQARQDISDILSGEAAEADGEEEPVMIDEEEIEEARQEVSEQLSQPEEELSDEERDRRRQEISNIFNPSN